MATATSTAAVDAEDMPAHTENANEKFTSQPSVKDEATVPNAFISQDAIPKDSLTTTGEVGSLRSQIEHNGVDPSNVHYPQPQTIYFGGYGNPAEWEEYSHYLTPDILDLGSPGIYNESQSLVFPTGYGYSVQMPMGPFSPVSPSPSSARGDGQMYSTPQFSFTGPYFHQSVPPSMPYLNSPTPLSQADLAMPVAVEHHGAFYSDASNSNGLVSGQRPNFPSYGSFGRNAFSGNSGNPSFYDSQGFDGFHVSAVWSDWMKSADVQRSINTLSPTPVVGAFGHAITPFSSGQGFHQQRPLHGYESMAGSYSKRNLHGGMYNRSSVYGSSFRINDRGWSSIDKGRHLAKEVTPMCSCSTTVDFLAEQNRGPRSTRQKNPIAEDNLSVECKIDNPNLVDRNLYNKDDFATEYEDAKFFVIKSYSEDNIHKSIKYGVWTSTPNGNRKLDTAFSEAKEKDHACPVFLFFSVNASAQFCGVAEMVGPVDFEKSVDYWQQNKWCGHFPVKWHIVKDVPNSILRHIILENNDSKPVTNSRDTQEVNLEQGLEMLSILKKHDSDMSILDDFDFYEARQKAMQERKTWQQQNQSHSTAFPLTAVGADPHHAQPLNLNFVNQMSKTFAQVVRLDENRKEEGPTKDTGGSEPNDVAS